MKKIKFFQELINSLFEKPKINKSLNFLFDKKKSLTTKEYVQNVASAKGEVSALGHAELLINHCEKLNNKELITFFELLRKNYEVNSDDLLLAIHNYEIEKTSVNLVKLCSLISSKRMNLCASSKLYLGVSFSPKFNIDFKLLLRSSFAKNPQS